MESPDVLKQIEADLVFTPVPGSPNIQTIGLRQPENPNLAGGRMTDADWDKFEADIETAFEQLR